MIIINTTFFVVDTHQNLFLNWVKNRYIPRMIELEYFSSPRFFKILSKQEPGTSSYSLQFESVGSLAKQKWEEEYSQHLEMEIRLNFNENVLSFSTLLEQL